MRTTWLVLLAWALAGLTVPARTLAEVWSPEVSCCCDHATPGACACDHDAAPSPSGSKTADCPASSSSCVCLVSCTLTAVPPICSTGPVVAPAKAGRLADNRAAGATRREPPPVPPPILAT